MTQDQKNARIVIACAVPIVCMVISLLVMFYRKEQRLTARIESTVAKEDRL